MEKGYKTIGNKKFRVLRSKPVPQSLLFEVEKIDWDFNPVSTTFFLQYFNPFSPVSFWKKIFKKKEKYIHSGGGVTGLSSSHDESQNRNDFQYDWNNVVIVNSITNGNLNP